MAHTFARRVRLASLGLGLAAVLAGCAAEDVAGPGGTGTNTPAVGVTGQGFGFSVVAQGFAFERTYASPSSGDSLAISLAVTSHGGGSALVEVADADGVIRFAQTVTQNLAHGEVAPGGRPPYTVHLRFTAFTGMFTLGVAARAS
jgi:hypothetical protein